MRERDGRGDRDTKRAAPWAAHDVRQHRSGTKRLHHPVVGDLELEFETLDVTADPGLVLQAYLADPGPRPTTR